MALTSRPPLLACALALALGCGTQTPALQDTTEGVPDATDGTAETTESDTSPALADTETTDDPTPDAEAPAPDTEASPADTTPDAPLPITDSQADTPEPTEDAPAPVEDIAAPTPDLAQPDEDIEAPPVDLLADLPACPGGVVAAAIASPLPKSSGSDAFTPWDGVGAEAVTGLITALYAGDTAGVLATVASIDYTACRGTGDEESLVLFAPSQPNTGHARAVWRMGPARALVLEAPHPLFDSNTAVESAYLFEAVQARGLIASGTHRCVSDVPSGCDGKTKACSSDSKPYTETDMAHAAVSVFQSLHEAFELGLLHVAVTSETSGPEGYLLISVHGMAGDGVSVSNGTTADTHPEALPAKLTLALMAALPDEPVTSCNAFDGGTFEIRLCGTTNMQGRATNGSTVPCTVSAPEASDHFAHMEQDYGIRQAPEPVAEALMSVFPLWE